MRYVNNKINSILSGSGYENKYPLAFHVPQWAPTQKYMAEAKMKTILMDDYPISYDLVGPGGTDYTNIIQQQLETHLTQWLNSTNLKAIQFDVPFWFTPQAHSWIVPDLGQYSLREPSAYEIKAMVNLGICYGAKGIHYFMFSKPRNHSTGSSWGDAFLEDNNRDNPIPRYTDSYGYPKWETTKQLNQKLALIGDELLSLTWQNAFYINNGTQPTGTCITNVQSIGDNAASTFVQLGIFKKTDEPNNENLEHFFVVNRRTMPTETRNIQITINEGQSIFTNWKVSEIGTGNTWTVHKTGSFQTSYEPGEGKLFKLEPVMIAGGNLVYNENIPLSTTLNIKGSVIVNSGVTLTLNPNSTFNFQNYKSLLVNGNLTGNGLTYNSISINFLAGLGMAPSSWGLRFEKGSSGNLNYFKVEGGRTGIFVNETPVTITNSFIQNCSYSCIEFYRSNYCAQGSSVVGNFIITTTTNPGNYGISLNYSSPDIRNNIISHFSKGIYCINNSSPSLGSYGEEGNNSITGNVIGLYAYANSNPYLGSNTPYVGGGDNKIYDNTSYNIYAYSMSNVLAENNWWGSNPPNTNLFFAGGKSSIDYTPWLTTPPTEAPVNNNIADLEKSKTKDISENDENPVKGESPTINIWENILLAKKYINEGKYLRAINICRNIINESPDTSLAYTALDILWEAGRKLSVPQLKTILRYIYNNAEQKPLFANAGSLLSGYLNNQTQLLDSIITRFSGQPIVESILLNKFLHQYYDLDDTASARMVLSDLDLLFPESESSLHAHLVIGDVLENPMFKQSLISNNFTVPLKYVLYNNYPNPFNPTTTIRYDLPNDGLVQLKVFDILGNEVATLVNEQKVAGKYEVNFNASSLASGVYIYKIQSGDFVSSKKMILLK